MQIFRSIVIPTVLILAGCATSETGNPYKKAIAPPGKAVVYLYRPNAVAGSGLTPTVLCAGSATELRPGMYHPFEIDPGHIQCTSSYYENSASVDLDVLPGHDYFVKEFTGMGFFIGHVHLATVDPDYGQSETEKCREE